MDEIFNNFLEEGFRRATALVSESDILQVKALPMDPPTQYLIIFDLDYLRLPNGDEVEVARGPIPIGVRFPHDYLRNSDPHLYLKIATVLYPELSVFHPNIHAISGTVCLGQDFLPGTPLDHLIWHLFDIFSYANMGLVEENSLNPIACHVLRDHPELVANFCSKPLRRRVLRSKTILREERGP